MATQQSLFNLSVSIEARDKGMERAAMNRAALLKHAKAIARNLAERNGEVTADDIQRALVEQGISTYALGNAAGSLFKGGEWEWTGKWVKSQRRHAHANDLRVWRLK